MIQKVIQKGSDLLRKKCTPVTDFKNAKNIINDLNDTIDYLKTTYAYSRGIGLAAPQIGNTVRITITEEKNGTRYVLINPEIIETSKEKKPIREGCISFLKFRGMVPRYDYVKVKAYDENGKQYIVEGNGDFAMLLQHELDHLDGILYINHLPNKEKDLFTVDQK